MTPSSNFADQIKQARQVGYSDDEIVGFLGQRPDMADKISQAKNSGYQSSEILDYLGGPQQAPTAKHDTGPRLKGTPQPPNTLASQVFLGPTASMVKGGERIAKAKSGSDVAGGASDIIRGAAAYAAPAMLPAAMTNPVTVIGGVLGSAGGGIAAEETAKALGAPEGYAELAGTGGALAGGAAGAMGANAAYDAMGSVDPHVAALRAWGMNKDPRILDEISNGNIKLSSGLSDLKPHMANVQNVQPGYANEAVIRALPNAKAANRSIWNQWMQRANGQFRDGEPIIRATIDSLKESITDPRAQALVDDAVQRYGRHLTPQEMEALLNEKNAELKSFYSQSKEVQAAAERAGADTLKSKALLEAQARALREMLYNTLDPEGQGAGPREIQARYGAMKAIEEAAHGRRTDIISEHPVTNTETAANIKVDPRAWYKQKLNSSEWLIENALNAADEPNPLPSPQGPYPTNPRQITTGDMIPPRPADSSYVRSVPAQQVPLAENRQIAVPQPGHAPLKVLPRGPAGTPRPLPPAQPPVDPSGNSIARTLGKQIWSALGGPQ